MLREARGQFRFRNRHFGGVARRWVDRRHPSDPTLDPLRPRLNPARPLDEHPWWVYCADGKGEMFALVAHHVDVGDGCR